MSIVPQIDKAAFSQENDVTAIGHCKAINLRLNVDNRDSVGLEPSNIDFNIEVTNARSYSNFNDSHQMVTSYSRTCKQQHLQA